MPLIMKNRKLILIVEDEKNTREGLAQALGNKYDILLADNGERALQTLSERQVDLVLSDLRLPGIDGMTLIRKAMAHQSQPICILLTAYGSIETAVEAMKAGAYDFLTKPVNLDQLEMVVERALRSRVLEQENTALRGQIDRKYGLESIIGNSKAMEEVFDTIRQVAPTRATVLIQGESGTGKELVARAIHKLSPRAKQPFVAVHCAALADTLLESELFGHERGAFTGATERRIGRFEMADGGTLFLDEISEVSPPVQVKLLRVLEERKFERVGGREQVETDIRLIAATNRDLHSLANQGGFRSDLFFRLNVVNITIPPLRERAEDILLLTRYFIKRFSEENNKPEKELTADAVNMLASHKWPGNVRELRNAIERMVVLSRSVRLTARDVPPEIAAAGRPGMEAEFKTDATLKDAGKRLIVAALEKHGGHRGKAAEQLGISRRTLHRKIREYGL